MHSQPAAFRAAEQGAQTEPCYLYVFDHAGTFYYVTDLDRDVTLTNCPASIGGGTRTFTSFPVEHQMPDETAELSSRQAVVAIAANDPALRTYFLTAPTAKVRVFIFRVNCATLPAADYATDVFTEFFGEALMPSFQGQTIQLACVSELASEDAEVARYAYQAKCNHALYGKGCLVSAAAHAKTTTVVAFNRSNKTIDVTVATMPDGQAVEQPVTAYTLEGGFVTELATGNVIGIDASELLGGTPNLRLYLQWWPATIANGISVKLNKGCRHIIEACRDDFNNLNGQEGVITGLAQNDVHVTGNVPAEWVQFANRKNRCVPTYNGAALNTSQWAINEAVDFGGVDPVNLGPKVIVFLNRTLAGGDSAKLPRIGGFGGHPYIPTANPAVDGVST